MNPNMIWRDDDPNYAAHIQQEDRLFFAVCLAAVLLVGLAVYGAAHLIGLVA